MVHIHEAINLIKEVLNKEEKKVKMENILVYNESTNASELLYSL